VTGEDAFSPAADAVRAARPPHAAPVGAPERAACALSVAPAAGIAASPRANRRRCGWLLAAAACALGSEGWR
jgi:hypothetical protein